ncbi:IS66 family insertion sequence element accessory protein TnpB [Acinetobacter baumannii]
MAKVAMQHQINANLLTNDSSVQINAPALKTPSIPQTDFLPVILHLTPVKQEAPLPPFVPEKKAVVYIRFHYMRHRLQGSDDRDRLVAELATELLLLIQV